MGFNAGDVAGRDSLRTRLREHLARVAALLDVWVWHRQPRFLGPRVELGSQTSAGSARSQIDAGADAIRPNVSPPKSSR